MEIRKTPVSDCYKSISALSTGLYKESGSRFLSFACPVSREEEVKNILRDFRKEYFDATHHCYAYRLGHTGDCWRAADDGEPSSSAGRPILGQLLSRGLSDVLVVVVRYFGGVKLGVPGLIRAYKTAAADALDRAEIIEKTAVQTVSVTFGYLQMNAVMKILKEFSAAPYAQQFDLQCTLRADIPLSRLDRFAEALQKTEGPPVSAEFLPPDGPSPVPNG